MSNVLQLKARTANFGYQWLALLLLFATGCTVGPDYCRPRYGCAESWESVAPDDVTPNTEEVDLRWWASFGDPILNQLIYDAVRCNPTVHEAAARVQEARAVRRLACSRFAPIITPSFSFTRRHDSGNQTFGGIIDPTTQLTFNEWDLEINASWEIDFWGRIRRQVQAANADLSAAIFDRRAAILSLVSEVALTYIELRGFQKELVVAKVNIEIQTSGVEITTARFEAGLTSQLDVVQQLSLLRSTEAAVPTIETLEQVAISRLGILLGRCPGDLASTLEVYQPIPPTPPDILLGFPCDLIRRRPDIRAAERELAAATANIGVAVADYFPRISFFQILGLATQDYQTFFDSGSLLWQAGIQLLGPIIQGANLRANVERQRALMCQAFARYKQVVLTAYEEVRNALVAYGNERERYQRLQEAFEASVASLDLSTELYANGLINFLDVLVAQNSVNELDNERVQSEAQLVINAVSIYKALGGGWETFDCLYAAQ